MFQQPIHEIQLSAIRLTPTERSGVISQSLGLLPARQHQRSHHDPVSPTSVLFAHPPMPSQHHPYPSRR